MPPATGASRIHHVKMQIDLRRRTQLNISLWRDLDSVYSHGERARALARSDCLPGSVADCLWHSATWATGGE